jgi:phosphoribosylformimino-5-aminoimidazole carboxamide ribotide isomerase
MLRVDPLADERLPGSDHVVEFASPDLDRVRSLVRSYDAEILVAGGVRDLDGLRHLRDAGVAGVILGEALLSGAIDYPAALEAAA